MDNLTNFYSQPTTQGTYHIGDSYHMYGSMQTTAPTMSSGSKYAPTMSGNGTFYYSADEFLQQSTLGYGQTKTQTTMLASSRPKDPAIGELAPVGDTLLPMLLCVVVYTITKTIRRLVHSRQSL